MHILPAFITAAGLLLALAITTPGSDDSERTDDAATARAAFTTAVSAITHPNPVTSAEIRRSFTEY